MRRARKVTKLNLWMWYESCMYDESMFSSVLPVSKTFSTEHLVLKMR